MSERAQSSHESEPVTILLCPICSATLPGRWAGGSCNGLPDTGFPHQLVEMKRVPLASAGPVELAPPGRYEALVAASRELVEAVKAPVDFKAGPSGPLREVRLNDAIDAVSRLLASGEGEER